jgi:hypothetical protein
MVKKMSNDKQDLSYWKQNAEENYVTTPISVLSYISKLEKHIEDKETKHTAELDRQDSARLVVAFMGILLGYIIGK